MNSQIDCICVYGTFGGRLDHVFGNINTLFEADQFTSTNVLQFSDDTVAFLLQKVMIIILVLFINNNRVSEICTSFCDCKHHINV